MKMWLLRGYRYRCGRLGWSIFSSLYNGEAIKQEFEEFLVQLTGESFLHRGICIYYLFDSCLSVMFNSCVCVYQIIFCASHKHLWTSDSIFLHLSRHFLCSIQFSSDQKKGLVSFCKNPFSFGLNHFFVELILDNKILKLRVSDQRYVIYPEW